MTYTFHFRKVERRHTDLAVLDHRSWLWPIVHGALVRGWQVPAPEASTWSIGDAATQCTKPADSRLGLERPDIQALDRTGLDNYVSNTAAFLQMIIGSTHIDIQRRSDHREHT